MRLQAREDVLLVFSNVTGFPRSQNSMPITRSHEGNRSSFQGHA